MYSSKKIVLDFDGTIFRLFTNYNLQTLVDRIYELLKDYPTAFQKNSDVFDAFFDVLQANISKNEKIALLKQIDSWLIAAETEALKTGIPVNGFFEFLKLAKKSGTSVSIVSNNSVDCIKNFFDLFKVQLDIPVLGRAGTHPELMKPNTFMLEEISRMLNCDKDDVIFIGDNYRDYECASNFGCHFIGMTPTASKKERLCEKVGDLTTVNNFFELSEIIF